MSHATADLALALRPFDSRWSVLERFQLRHEHSDTGASPNNALAVSTFTIGDRCTLRTINNLSLSYRTGAEGGTHGFEASLYHGAKFVRGRYAEETVDGFIQMAGVELRKDVGRRIDLSASASVRHSLSDHSFTFAAGPAVGVSPGGNLWISAGYNVSGYRDRDFEQDRYTRRGPYLTMRLRLDRGLFASAANTLRGMR